MEFFGTLKFDNRFDKVWIIKITNKDKDGKWNGEFLKRQDLHFNERKNGTKVKDDKYIYKFNIEKKGVYKTNNIDGIDEKFSTRYCYIDPNYEKNGDGFIISASIIEEILNKDLSLEEVLIINNKIKKGK